VLLSNYEVALYAPLTFVVKILLLSNSKSVCYSPRTFVVIWLLVNKDIAKARYDLSLTSLQKVIILESDLLVINENRSIRDALVCNKREGNIGQPRASATTI
jgi:hypothetical protein